MGPIPSALGPIRIMAHGSQGPIRKYLCKLTTLGSDNGFSPRQCQVIIWTNVGVLLIGPLGTNFSEILIQNDVFSFKKMHFKMLSGN